MSSTPPTSTTEGAQSCPTLQPQPAGSSVHMGFSGKEDEWVAIFFLHHDAPPTKKTLVALRREELQEQLPLKNHWVILCPLGAVFPITKDGKRGAGRGRFVLFSPFYSTSPYPLCFWFVKNPSKPRKGFSSSVILVNLEAFLASSGQKILLRGGEGSIAERSPHDSGQLSPLQTVNLGATTAGRTHPRPCALQERKPP